MQHHKAFEKEDKMSDGEEEKDCKAVSTYFSDLLCLIFLKGYTLILLICYSCSCL